MKGELYYVDHPLRMRIYWALFYLLLIGALVFGVYKVTNRIETHTLPTGEIQLKIPYSKYLVGEPVTFSLVNNFNSPIYIVNNCPSEPLEVYRQENNRWVRIHDQASVADCPSQVRQISVPANGVVNGSYASWHNLFSTPGKYRVVAFVEYYNSLPYQEFEIVAKPEATNSQSQVIAQSSTPAAVVGQTILPLTNRQEKTISTNLGSVKIQYDSSTIYVITVNPKPGCGYEGGRSGPSVEITFKCGGTETQLQLSLINGRLVQRIETDN